MMTSSYYKFLNLIFAKNRSYVVLFGDNNLFWHSISSNLAAMFHSREDCLAFTSLNIDAADNCNWNLTRGLGQRQITH